MLDNIDKSLREDFDSSIFLDDRTIMYYKHGLPVAEVVLSAMRGSVYVNIFYYGDKLGDGN